MDGGMGRQTDRVPELYDRIISWGSLREEGERERVH